MGTSSDHHHHQRKRKDRDHKRSKEKKRHRHHDPATSDDSSNDDVKDPRQKTSERQSNKEDKKEESHAEASTTSHTKETGRISHERDHGRLEKSNRDRHRKNVDDRNSDTDNGESGDRRHKRHKSNRDEKKRSKSSRRRDRSTERDRDSDDESDSYQRSKDRRHGNKKSHSRKEDRRSHKKEKKKDSRRSRGEASRRGSSSKKEEKSKFHHALPQAPDKATLFPMGDPIGHPPQVLIDPDTDYYAFHQEFWVYLYREEGIRFNDLVTTEETRQAFARFATVYNSGGLEAPYYHNHGLAESTVSEPFPAQVLEECKTTQHKWKFQTTETERKGLQALQEGVRRLTEYQDEKDKSADSRIIPNSSRSNDTSRNDSVRNVADYPTRKTPQELTEERRSNKRLRDHVRNVNVELSGGAKDFRERQLEKKKELADRIHGASRDKEQAATSMELSDSALYGDGDTSFQNALARERNAKNRRQEKQTQRIEELKEKERERQENMLKVLGLEGITPGQKIQIAPRND